MKTFTPFFFLLLLLPAVLTAQTTYTNNGTGDWDNAAIWTPNGVPGTGDIAVVGTGTITLTDNVTIGSLYMSAGVITGDSSITITDSLNWSGGEITFSSILSNLKPTLTIAGTAKASFNGDIAIYRNMINDGEVHWSNGVLRYSNESVFENNGIFTVEANDYLRMYRYACNHGHFRNYGSYIKTGAATNTIGIYFQNFGVVDLRSGRLEVAAGAFTDTGSYTIAEGSSIHFANGRIFEGSIMGAGDFYFRGEGPYTVKDTFNITGVVDYWPLVKVTFAPGSTFISGPRMINHGGSLTFNTGKKVVIDSIRLTSSYARIYSSDSLVIKKYAYLSAGMFGGGTGKTIINQDANVILAGNVYFLAQVDNYGTFHWEKGDFRLMYDTYSGGSPVFNNYGLFIDETTVSSSIVRYSGWENHNFNNFGTYQKKNLVSTEFADYITFVNKENGILKGVGSITFVDPIVNSGTISPGDSVGVLNLKLDYPSESTSSVNIDIGGTVAGTEYDRLEIDGNATLKGTLNIQLLDAYIPEEGDIFEVMKFTSRTDIFDIVIGTEISNCRYFAVQYSDTAVCLEVYGIEPPQAEKDVISERQDRPVEINVLANDTDPDGDTLTVLSVGDPLHGTAVVNGDSTILYTPETGFVGLDSLIYVIQKRSGCIDSSWIVVDVLSTVGIEELSFNLPRSFSVEQNYPNPFHLSTTFNFSIPEEAFVELRIYNIHGKLMNVLVSKKLPVGTYSYEWEAPEIVEGIYIYQFSANRFIQTGKMFKQK